METIRVNMTPCEDIKTIHASQNDNEGREWGFELHNNGDKIDSSSISDQMVFKTYEGGTEEILPTNGSTPTTSPFKGDIKYPQGLLSDQEFLYRESPTEEDGLAKITDIKGNTLNWNQLVQNGNFDDASNWYARQSTFTVSNNVSTVTPSTEGTERGIYSTAIPVKANHKYLLSCEIKPPVLSTARVSFGGSINYGFDTVIQASQWSKCQGIVLNDIDRNIAFYSLIRNSLTPSQTIQFRNMMVIDLTQMGLDISSPSDFTSLFPLPYYAYSAGSLLSFNGTGIKATGVNLFNINNYSSMDSAWTLTDGVLESNNNRYKNYVSETITGTGKTYTLSFKYNVSQNRTYAIQIYNKTDNVQVRRFEFQSTLTSFSLTDVLESGKEYDIRVFGYSASSGTIKLYDVQLEIGSTATDYAKYIEPFNLSLPISVYFPTGMKRAGAVYDELTDSKAITRVGTIDLGTLTYTQSATAGGGYRFSVGGTQIPNIKPSTSNSDIMNAVFALGRGVSQSNTYNNVEGVSVSTSGVINIYIEAYKNYTTEQFKSAMNGVMLYYELATPTETSFTTASLVTENAEIPLSNEDGTLIGKCTEELSAEPGFYDAKIKLADADGECYSNKIQLHVERSPQ